MPINIDLNANKIKRGVTIDLSKEAPGVKKFEIGLGWNQNAYDGDAFDLDAMVFRVDESGKVTQQSDVIFYGMPGAVPEQAFSSPEGDVHHSGDERVGAKPGDDEMITIDTEKTPAYLSKYIVFLGIFDAEKRNQTFGMVDGAAAEIRDAVSKKVIATIDLSEQNSSNTIINAFEIIRSKDGSGFKAKNVSQGFNGGINAALASVGVSASS